MRKRNITAMTKPERMAAAIAGEEVDRVPWALWRRPASPDPEELAEADYGFCCDYDVDLLKTAGDGLVPAEDFLPQAGLLRSTGGAAIRKAEDWRMVEPASLHAGVLAREQAALKFLLQKTAGEVPVVFTVMSPLTQAHAFCPQVADHVKEGQGDLVKQALSAITETTCQLVRRAIELGADGIFFDTRLASYDLADESFYREYGMPYDLAVLSASQGWCNVLHASGRDIMFPLLRKYPVQIFSWHAAESLPTIPEAQMLMGACAMGGLDYGAIRAGHKNEAEYQLYKVLRQTRGRGLVLSTGRAVDAAQDGGMLSFLRKEEEEIAGKLLGRR